MLTDGDWLGHSTNVVSYLTAARSALKNLTRDPKEPEFTLSWDELPTSVDDDCAVKTGSCEYRRCYNSNISTIVDWVNLMLYNADNTVRMCVCVFCVLCVLDHRV